MDYVLVRFNNYPYAYCYALNVLSGTLKFKGCLLVTSGL